MKSKPKYPQAILFLAALGGCDAAAGPALDHPAIMAAKPLIYTKGGIRIPAWMARVDQCEIEKLNVRTGGNPPAPWLSYCENPRPVLVGTFSEEEYNNEKERLKREWEAERGPINWPPERSELMKRLKREWEEKYNLAPLALPRDSVEIHRLVKEIVFIPAGFTK